MVFKIFSVRLLLNFSSLKQWFVIFCNTHLHPLFHDLLFLCVAVDSFCGASDFLAKPRRSIVWWRRLPPGTASAIPASSSLQVPHTYADAWVSLSQTVRNTDHWPPPAADQWFWRPPLGMWPLCWIFLNMDENMSMIYSHMKIKTSASAVHGLQLPCCSQRNHYLCLHPW